MHSASTASATVTRVANAIVANMAKAKHSVIDALRQDILNDTLPAGSRLVESALCERYDVSRAAVRAALLELTAEDLVGREVNRGATVRRITVSEAIEITEARAAIEGLIAAHAARNATEAEREELTDIVRRMHAAVGTDDVLAYGQLNQTLHRRLREVANHKIAGNLVDNLRNRSVRHQFRLSLVPGRPKESLAQHEAIVTAVVAGDEAAASAAMVDHLNSVAGVLRRWGDVAPY